uniref:N-acyl-aliphatic-L-amino acid amidohydrolase n=1 Tax=Anthurium amnicola TaxID=1678845 RepID=A0A1D1XEP2_9ARAE
MERKARQLLPPPSLLLPLSALLPLLLSSAATTTAAAAADPGEDAAAISRFQQYLRINTAHPDPDYAGAAQFLLSQARELALESETLEFVPGKPLVLLRWPGSDPSLPSVLLNSHTDVVPAEAHKWTHPPFAAAVDPATGRIHARGSQDMKCVGAQYLEAIRRLKAAGFVPDRTVYLSFVPDEEIGGSDGAGAFAASEEFRAMGVGVVLDEGLASPGEDYRVFYGEMSPWWTVIRASGAPGHGAKLFDNSAMENLMKSVEMITRFRAAQFHLVKAGVKAEGEVISVNMVYLKAGTPSPTGFVMNLQPSEAEAGFDIRVPPNVDIEALERRIDEEWAPPSRNMTFEFKHKVPVHDMFGKPAVTSANSSNPWWTLLEGAVKKANGKLSKPEIFPASTDLRYFRERGLPAFGFSPMANTPILLHDHNEFLNQAEYLRGIGIYESIIRAFASYNRGSDDKRFKDEL